MLWNNLEQYMAWQFLYFLRYPNPNFPDLKPTTHRVICKMPFFIVLFSDLNQVCEFYWNVAFVNFYPFNHSLVVWPIYYVYTIVLSNQIQSGRGAQLWNSQTGFKVKLKYYRKPNLCKNERNRTYIFWQQLVGDKVVRSCTKLHWKHIAFITRWKV